MDSCELQSMIDEQIYLTAEVGRATDAAWRRFLLELRGRLGEWIVREARR